MFNARLLAFLITAAICLQVSGQAVLQTEVVRVEAEGTVHRVSLAIPEGASVLSLFSDEAHPLIASAVQGFYQSDDAALLFQGADALDTDSWFTIGIPSGTSNVQATGGAGWTAATEAFASGGTFSSSDSFGGGFFLLPFSSQGESNGGEVLLGQFVSPGPVDLTLNVQWKPSAELPAVLETGLSVTLQPFGQEGCTSELALNFNPDALIDDGSCTYPTGSFTGLSFSVHEAATAALPPTYRIYANFSNPNEGLVSWFGTAESPLHLQTTTSFYQMAEGGLGYPEGNESLLQRDSWVTLGNSGSSIIVGLSGEDFENGQDLISDPEFGGAVASFPGSGFGLADSLGRVLMAQITTEGEVNLSTNLSVLIEGGTSEEVTGVVLTIPGNTPGCTDVAACNFDVDATEDDGSCQTLDALEVCGGDCSADFNNNGICDDEEVAGCTDPSADNYNAQATEDDGSCISEPNEPDTSAAGFIGLTQQQVGMGPGGEMLYRVYAQFDSAGYELISIFGTEQHPWMAVAEAGFYQSPDGGPLATNLPAVSTATSAMDSWFTIGGDANGSVSLLSVGLDFTEFEAGGDFEESDPNGGGLAIIPGTEPDAISGPDGRVLVAQLASSGSMSVLVNIKFKNLDGGSPEVMGVAISIPPSVEGCNDAQACNYSPSATFNNGSCIYADSGYDCTGACLGDADNDGVCDDNEYMGCTALDACNYDPLVDPENQVADSCLYPVDVFGVDHLNCSGNCLNDSDGDGVCDEDEQEGCTYSTACNFDPDASEEDGSCLFAAPWKDCEGECWFDFNGDGICDEPGIGGCAYPEAYNYNPTAAYDDGSCVFPTGDCRFDSNGDGGVNISDLLDMLVALGSECP